MNNPDKNLDPVLSQAPNEDLEPLVDYILKAKASEELSNHPDYKMHCPNH